jgi:hypothetical protein
MRTSSGTWWSSTRLLAVTSASAAVILCTGLLLPNASASAALQSHSVVTHAAGSAVGTAAANHAGRAVTGRAPTATQLAAQTATTAETEASLQAQRTGGKVVVTAETGTGTLLTANPNGSFTLTQTSEPVRVKQNGVWVPINPDLVSTAGGMLQAEATATGVAFSGGGTGPMVAITSGANRLSFSFPYPLPRPTVSGPSASYSNVLPGVDLQLTANASGFSEMLIVRTRAAAASPALRALRLGIASTGVTLADTPDGGAQALNMSGGPVFHTDTAAMWDSAGIAMTSGSASAAAAAGPAASGPAQTSHLGRVAVHVSATSETLVPDASLLDSPNAKLPIYIDPAWSGNPSQLKWARISSNGWNIYNSTSTAGADHPRSGWDNWPGGAGEIARTYYQMATGGSTGTTGFLGAHVSSSTLDVVNNWSAYSSPTDCEIYLSNAPVNNGWNSTDLNWSNKPAEISYQDEKSSYETSSGTVSPGTLQFTVTGAAQEAASKGWSSITYELKSNSESNADYWKQYASGGGATMTTTYWRDPDLVSGTGEPVTTPAVTDAGTTFVTSATPTLKITSEDTDGENVRNIYQIYNYSGGTETTQVGSNIDSGYAKNGGPVTSGTLANGTFAWRAEAESYGSSGTSNQYYSPWTAWQLFTVDTSDPPAPGVASPQFPANQFGGAYSDQGTFTFTTDGSDNVKGYLFSLDGDLGSTVYGGSGIVTWAAGTKPVAGKPYWIPATTDPNGYAQAIFAPGVAGPHRIFAKAVDQADNTSASETTYLFYAGFTTPAYVFGDQLVNGYTAADGTVVPAGTATVSAGATFATQANCCGVAFGDGYQAFLQNGSGKVAVGDSVTVHFEIPTTGYYDLGASLTEAKDYGQYSMTLDANSATGTPAATLVTGHDAYNPFVAIGYANFGVPMSGGSPIQLPKGVYALTLTITGQNASSAGYQAGIDALRIAPMSATCSITGLSGCYNNAAISDNNNTAIAETDADGYNDSYAADQLAAAGWNPGTAITVDGAPMTLPASYGTGQADNIVAGGQTITVPSGYANDGNAVVFLAFATDGTVSNATGTITYASPCGVTTTQGYTLSTVPDWVTGPANAAATSFAGRDTFDMPDNDSQPSRVYAISVPLACPGSAISSITLPVVSNGVTGGTTALHILALGIRASSYTDTTNTANWTATFAAQEDSHFGSVGQTTVRMPAVTSVGGTQLRIHLSNALGTVPVTFDHVTVAAQSSGAMPLASTMTNVTFSGSASVTIPAGGDVTSDPVNFTASQQETLLVSVYTNGTVSDTVGHSNARDTAWITTSTADEAADTSGTPFTQTMDSLYWLTGVDVTPSVDSTTGATFGAVAFYGDQTINSDTSSGQPNRFTDQVAADLATANSGDVPYGVLNLGDNSWSATNNLIPVVSTNTTPLSAIDPIDRDILDQANIRTVLISTGTADILAGESVTTVENNLVTLVHEISSFSADTSSSGLITVYVATIPPSTQFTSTQEAVRESVNQFICGPGGSYLNGAAQGCIDFAAAVSSDGTDTGSTVNPAYLYNSSPSDAYYAAEAQAYLTDSQSTVITPPDTVIIRANRQGVPRP